MIPEFHACSGWLVITAPTGVSRQRRSPAGQEACRGCGSRRGGRIQHSGRASHDQPRPATTSRANVRGRPSRWTNLLGMPAPLLGPLCIAQARVHQGQEHLGLGQALHGRQDRAQVRSDNAAEQGADCAPRRVSVTGNGVAERSQLSSGSVPARPRGQLRLRCEQPGSPRHQPRQRRVHPPTGQAYTRRAELKSRVS